MMRKLLKPIKNFIRSAIGTNGVAELVATFEGKLTSILTSVKENRAAEQLSAIDVKLEALSHSINSNSLANHMQALGEKLEVLLEQVDANAVTDKSEASGAKPKIILDAETSTCAGAITATTFPEPTYDFNLILHQARSSLMRDMPPNAERLLSAGCSGRWYFDWIAQTYGYVPQHLGIEYYSPKPDSLPNNVTWIANTAGNMEAVSDKSCDLLISGQNIEHLWPDDIADFLVESARVLNTGGTLCVDTPNRTITKLLGWSQPEHTIELTAPEMRQLLDLAGFEITKEAGIWLCQDPKTCRVMSIDPNAGDPEWSVTERIFSAADKPEHSFIWWMESRRTEREPDREGLRKLLASIFTVAWPERIQRLVVLPVFNTEHRSDGEWIVVPPMHDGLVFYGPYMPLRAGRHLVTFEFESDPTATATFARCDIMVGGKEPRIIDQREVLPNETNVTFEVKVSELTFGAQFRCISIGRSGFKVRRYIKLVEELDDVTQIE
ncbi:class I SAM-dependent methyltransferase [Caballeronia sp. M23-90]